MALEDEQRVPTEATINALIEVLPDTWNQATLRLVRRTHPDGSEGVVHSIKSPEGRRDLLELSDKLYDATWQLAQIFEKYGQPWKAATIQVAENSTTGKWEYQIAYEY